MKSALLFVGLFAILFVAPLFITTAVAVPAVEPAPLRDKTLVAWVAPANLVQRGGVLTLDAGQGLFDGIVFGEQTPKKWMPGSEGWRRTQPDQAEWPAETADGKEYDIWAEAIEPKVKQVMGDNAISPVSQKPLDTRPEWEMGPFVKLAAPVLSPAAESKFQCPLQGKEVRWEEQNVYNPAVVVRGGKVYLLYRADDKCWWKFGTEDQATSRIGLASSEDGRHFTRHPLPVVFPDKDAFTKYEWPGGCQDLHVVEGEDGIYYMNYTAWGEGGMDSMCVATSKDLIHWQKHGPAFAKFAPGAVRSSRSGVIVARQAGEKLLPAKVNGQYLMYYTHPSALAVSDNLIDWKPLGKQVWGGGHESGAIALWRDEGILLFFNSQDHSADVNLPTGSWTLGQALIDRANLTTVLRHQQRPLLQPVFDWEKKGYCPVPATVSNGLVYFKGEWLLYYGAADRHIGLAVFTPKANSPFSLAH